MKTCGQLNDWDLFQIKLWDELITINGVEVSNLRDHEICELARGPLGSEVMLGFQRKDVNSLTDFSVNLRRELSSAFGPDISSVSWKKKEANPRIALHPHLQHTLDHLLERRNSLYKKIFQDPASGILPQMNIVSDIDPKKVNKIDEEDSETKIRQIHSQFFYRQKYYLIL